MPSHRTSGCRPRSCSISSSLAWMCRMVVLQLEVFRGGLTSRALAAALSPGVAEAISAFRPLACYPEVEYEFRVLAPRQPATAQHFQAAFGLACGCTQILGHQETFVVGKALARRACGCANETARLPSLAVPGSSRTAGPWRVSKGSSSSAYASRTEGVPYRAAYARDSSRLPGCSAAGQPTCRPSEDPDRLDLEADRLTHPTPCGTARTSGNEHISSLNMSWRRKVESRPSRLAMMKTRSRCCGTP